ncbi:MAG: hypothetical protein C0482_29155 [Gordonia sp.]|nr:hypothetical protein [Gordonia sp. (in: high G+C Gram-positive bacteria)]
MTVIAGPTSAALDCAIGSCPEWVSGVFTDMYPDDAVALPTRCAATVLACDEDWGWIADHCVAVAAAVDEACTVVFGAGAGEWVVGRGTVEGEGFVVCTSANSAGTAASGVGNVVLVLRPASTGLPADSFTLMSR